MSTSEALPLPADLAPRLAEHPGIDWATLAAESLRAKADALDRAEATARRSRLSADRAREVAARLREGADAPGA